MPTPQGYQAALHKQQATQYKEQQVRTASKEQLLIMLYDGAIRFTKIAKKAMETGNLEKSNEHLIKAQRIVTEFMASLDQDTGGEAAKNLFQLYEYLHYRLVQANIKKDPEMIVEVTDHLRDLRDTWEKAIDIASQEKKGGGEKTTANDA
jgi:flagellar secretion chaperone FliS